MLLRRASTISPSSSIFSSLTAITRLLLLGDRGDVRRLRALPALARLELHPGALCEGLEAVALDAGVVDEHVLAAFVGRDEAVALRVVEPLHGSGCHMSHLPSLSRTGREA